MPPKKKSTNSTATGKVQKPSYDLEGVIAALRRSSSKVTRDGMPRYGLPADKAFGVPVGTMRQLAQRIGPHHELAAALWKSGWYEARMALRLASHASPIREMACSVRLSGGMAAPMIELVARNLRQ
jgi:hypothetical protein